MFSWFADGVSVVSDTDLESSSEHTNGSPQASQLSDRQDAGDSMEICHTARSTLLRYCAAQQPTKLLLTASSLHIPWS